MNRAPILLAALLTASYAHAAERASIPQESVETTQRIVFKPAIGEAASAEVGENLYQERLRTVSKRSKITLISDVTTLINTKYTLSAKAGRSGPLLRRPGSAASFFCMPATRPGLLGIGTKTVVGCLVDTNATGSFDHVAFAHTNALHPLSAPVPYKTEITETVAEDEEKFHIHLLYQGMSKGEVKISYREFINGLARPAFDQDVSYELDADGTGIIGFKGARIKVLKATGHSITYVLEQPMPPRITAPSETKTPIPWYQ